MHLRGSLRLSVHRVGGLAALSEAKSRKGMLLRAFLVPRKKQAVFTLSGEYRIVGCAIKGWGNPLVLWGGAISEHLIRPNNEKGLQTVICNPLILLVRPAGFEPTTPWFVARYSIHRSYGRL